MTLQEFARKHRACEPGLAWLVRRDLRAMWAECERSDWMLWLLKVMGWDDTRTQRLFACWCARQVWHLLTDERSRNAVEVAERHAFGVATADELESAWSAACEWYSAWYSAAAIAADAASADAAKAAAKAAKAAAKAANASAALSAQCVRLREVVPVEVVEALFAAAIQEE